MDQPTGQRLSWIAASLTAMLLIVGLVHPSDGQRPLSEHRVIAEGIPLSVWAKSPPSPTRVVLLIHGRTWSTRPDFDLQVPGEELSLMDGLVAQGIATYGVDLLGYGKTPRQNSGWLTPSRAAADVIKVLEWMGQRHPQLPKAHLFGWSYGALVSQLVVQQRPQLVSGLIMFGYPLRPGIAMNPSNQPDVAPRLANTAAAAASDFITPDSISEQAIEAFVASALEHDPIRVDWRGLNEWLMLDAKKVTVPTLLLDAEHDPVSDAAVLLEAFT
ncbi:MAG: alpha/beta fold hydrolase, partial [Gammaproteobacteria bacterium]|nr:alpha/beta fold hydrolase [Gammaproteobacteria bacterium]